jgi:transcriptional regulator
MYPPPIHQEANFANAVLTIKTFPLATCITVHQGEALVTHLPLIYHTDESCFGYLIGHLDRHNPQAQYLNEGRENMQAIFHGPDTYISPTRYSTPQLPTWNYIKVHVSGPVTILGEDETKQSLITMTDLMETNQLNGKAPGDSEERFILREDDNRMAKLLPHILGFKLKIERWEGKYKLSQDKNATDRAGAREALAHSAQTRLEGYLDNIYAQHQNQQK